MTLSNQDFERLLQANRILSSKLDRTELLQSVMELASQVVKSQAASILLLDEKTDELYFDVALGEAKEQIKQVRLKVGEGLAGWVAKNRQAAIVNDVQKDDRWSGKGDKRSDFKTRQILAVPLLTRERLIGVVEAINKIDGSPFTEEDQKAFEAFASQAAVAIENSGLFAEVQSEKEKLSLVFSEMSDGALLVDGSGQIQLMNTAASHFFGVALEETIGVLNVRELLNHFDITPSLENLLAQNKSQSPIELKRKEGKIFYLSGNVNRLVDAKGWLIGFLVVLRDVTEARKEEILKRNFLSLMSHKLKTPLVSIVGYSPVLLEDRSKLTEFQVMALTTIKDQSLAMALLVDKLINFSLVESDTLELERRPQEVSKIVETVLTYLHSYIDSMGAKITVDPAIEKLPPVNVDGDRVREVFKNLIENAIKFNPEEERTVRVSGARDKKKPFVTISIEDNGTGIPPEEREKIFQKFYQIEEAFTGQIEGAGLGLALVRRVVEAHGGTVTLQSTVGRGSTFSFTLPCAP